MFALVALNAKEQTKTIADLLDDDYRGGDAAVALALMGGPRIMPIPSEI